MAIIRYRSISPRPGSGPPNGGITCSRDDELQAGIESRTTIGQAQGLLMAWFDIEADEAFRFLKRRSSLEQRKLFDIAAELVRTKHRPNAETWRDAQGSDQAGPSQASTDPST